MRATTSHLIGLTLGAACLSVLLTASQSPAGVSINFGLLGGGYSSGRSSYCGVQGHAYDCTCHDGSYWEGWWDGYSDDNDDAVHHANYYLPGNYGYGGRAYVRPHRTRARSHSDFFGRRRLRDRRGSARPRRRVANFRGASRDRPRRRRGAAAVRQPPRVRTEPRRTRAARRWIQGFRDRRVLGRSRAAPTGRGRGGGRFSGGSRSSRSGAGGRGRR